MSKGSIPMHFRTRKTGKRHNCQRAKKPVKTVGKTGQFVVFCLIIENYPILQVTIFQKNPR